MFSLYFFINISPKEYVALPYKEENTMKYICELCGWIYDEKKGDPSQNIPPGTPFTELPEDYECPGCYCDKTTFYEYDD